MPSGKTRSDVSTPIPPPNTLENYLARVEHLRKAWCRAKDKSNAAHRELVDFQTRHAEEFEAHR